MYFELMTWIFLRGPSAMLNFPNKTPDIPSTRELSASQIQAAASTHARIRADLNVVAHQQLKPEVEFGFLEDATLSVWWNAREEFNIIDPLIIFIMMSYILYLIEFHKTEATKCIVVVV
jgi:hypothetical protein